MYFTLTYICFYESKEYTIIEKQNRYAYLLDKSIKQIKIRQKKRRVLLIIKQHTANSKHY